MTKRWTAQVASGLCLAASLGSGTAFAVDFVAVPTVVAFGPATVAAGSSFTLEWHDLFWAGGSSYTDAELFIVYDASSLTLLNVTAGPVLNGTTVTRQGNSLLDGDYTGYTSTWFTATAGAPLAAAGPLVFSTQFSVAANAVPGDYAVYAASGLPAGPDTYTFTSDGASFAVTSAVPEPTTCALLLAGLGLVGAAAQRRKVVHG